MQRIALLASSDPRPTDAIAQYSAHIAEAISAISGYAAAVFNWDFGAKTWVRHGGGPFGLPDADYAVLQYNPFAYGRRGWAPWLVRAIRGLRVPAVTLYAHETWVRPESAKLAVMRCWQQPQLIALCRSADGVIASTEGYAETLSRWARHVRHVPVGSNLPDRRDLRAAARSELGAGEHDLVIAAFGSGHPSRDFGLIAEATSAVAARRQGSIVMNLGADAPALAGHLPGTSVVQPGYLTAEALAAHLAAADLALMPWLDGASTRRTSLIAAMQHGIATISTAGRSTGPSLRGPSSGVLLVDVSDRAGFVRAAVRLSEDADARASLAAEARGRFVADFDWPVIASRFVASLPTSQ